MRLTLSKPAVLACLTAFAAATVAFSLTALADHGRALPMPDGPEEDRPALASAASLEANEVQVSIQPSQSVVAPGESFTVAVAIENAPEIIGYDFHMAWDPTVFSVTMLGDDLFLGPGAWTPDPVIDNEEGTLYFGALLTAWPPPPDLSSGDGDLAIVTLLATDVGTSTLDLYRARVFTRTQGQIWIADPGDGMAESICEAAEIVGLEADSPVELGQTTGFTATVNGARPITFTWDFDADGSPERTGTGLDTVSHAYAATGTYTAALSVNNVCGVADAETVTVTVEEAPCQAVQIAALAADPSLTAGLPAHFTATVTGAQPITYTWDFDGDGSPERVGVGLDVVTHTYAAAGTYTATLTVENACPSQATKMLWVTVEEACEDVTITSLSSESPVKIGEAMGFTATVTGTVPYTYTWDFGDGGAGSGTGLDTATPSWTYTEAGSYTATLTVDNPCGTDEESEIVRVESYAVFLPVILKEYP